MASTARGAAAPRARRASGGRAAARPRPGVATTAISLRGIRWDRVARLSLLIALLFVLLLYVKPVTRYFEAWRLSGDTQGEVKELRGDNAALRARAKELRQDSRVELEARRLGMARPGERVYVVRGLPK
jgi:cell division protein FtsB